MQNTVDILKTEARDKSGTRTAKNLRKKGKTPVVLYGHGEGTQSLAIDSIDLWNALRTGHHVVTLQVDGKEQKALIKETQYDPLGDDILHVDFTRISAHERVEVAIPMELIGQPKGVENGGVLTQNLHELNVSCPADQIPDKLELNVTELLIGDQLTVSDVPRPDNLEILHDAEETVVVIQRPMEETVEEMEEGLEAAEAAQPEVIGREGEGEEEGQEESEE